MMKKPMFVFAVAALLSTASALSAQLPDAESLYAKYSAAMGGTELMKLTSVRQAGTFAIPAAGLSGTVEILRSQPNKSIVRISLPDIGDIVQGYDGKVGYSMSPMTGNSLLEGKDLESQAEDGQFGATLGAPEFFTSMETIERTTMGGVECYKVRLEWKSGRTTYDCFGVESGLRVGSVATQDGPSGPLEVVITLSDYRKFGEITMATKIVQLVAGNEQVITIDTVEFDTVENRAFDLPAAIRALIPVPEP